ncbi:hypothetical protein HYT58_02955, partial [Candidatus Woesearchaeota archaeon]|nr:hypothetical protein [Candidatus Woesearchaeota archaeon]
FSMGEVITNGVLQVGKARRILEEEIKNPETRTLLDQDLENTITMIRGLPQGIVSAIIGFVVSEEKDPFVYVPGDHGWMGLKGGTKLSNIHYGRAGRLYHRMMVLGQPQHGVDTRLVKTVYDRFNNEIEHDGVEVG